MPIDERLPARRTPHHHRQPFRLRPVAQAMSIAVCGMALVAALPQPAWAQAGTAQAARQSYSVPAGPLAPALRNLASTANLLLTFTEAQTAGKTTQGINGAYTPQAAMAALLAGTGLQAAPLDNGAYVLRAAPAAQAAPPVARSNSTPTAATTALAPVTVTAEADRSGTTEGTGAYTTRSSTAATGLNLSLRETPQSVSVITRQRMDDQGLTNLGDTLAESPGIVYQAQGTRAPLYARGYQVNSYQIDGLNVSPYAFSFGGGLEGSNSLDTAIYDSVTVIRGATGLLTGAGDPGATISLTRKRPTREFQASVSQTLGRWDRHRTVADVGGPVNEAGTLRTRLVAAYDAGEGWQDRYRYDKTVVYGVVEADLSRDTMLTLALERSDEDAKGFGPYTGMAVAFTDETRTPFGRHENSMTDWSRFQKRHTAATLILDHRFNDDWKAKLAYSRNDFRSKLKFGNVAAQPDPDGLTDLMVRSYRVKNYDDTLQLKLDGRYELFGRRHDLMAGASFSSTPEKTLAFYTDRTYDRVNTFGWNGQYPEPDFASLEAPDSRYKTRQTGLWLATRLRPTDALSVIAGARWSRWDYRVTSLTTGDVSDDRAERGVITPYVGIVQDLTENFSAYASYTTIFNPQSNRDVNGRVLDPEEGRNVELGLKGEWFGGRLNASAAVFEVVKDNLAVLDGGQLTPLGDDAYRAADNTKGRGWEFEVAGEVMPGWQVQGGYTRMLTRASDGTRLNTDQPKHLFKLYTSWTPRSLARLTLGGGVAWQSEIYADWVAEQFRSVYTQRSYAVTNLMARYAFNEHLGLTVNLNNVFDKGYRTSTENHAYGAPRNLSATLKYQF